MPSIRYDTQTIALIALAAAVCLLPFVRQIRKASRQWLRKRNWFGTVARKTQEQRQSELFGRQLAAVKDQQVTFSKSRVMGGGEYGLFRAVLSVTRQPIPSGTYPFYVFPQVSLGEIIRANAGSEWSANQAHRAINSKRCDLLIADRHGFPIAVLEYQGTGHNLGATAVWRDEIKRIAVERAGIRYVAIRAEASPAEMQQVVRDVLRPYVGQNAAGPV